MEVSILKDLVEVVHGRLDIALKCLIKDQYS